MVRRQGGRWGHRGGATRAGEGVGWEGSWGAGPSERLPEVRHGRPPCERLQVIPVGEHPPRAKAVRILEAWLEGLSQRTPLCVRVCAEFYIYVSETS